MRSREQVIWDFVQEWLRKAESDLQAAEILLKEPSEDYFPSAFHSQQAAEKFLKAYLVRQQIEFSKTHNLDRLVSLASGRDASFNEELSACGWLSPFGVEFRYPGEYPVVDLRTAKRALKEAQNVKRTVMKRLTDYLAQGRPSGEGS